MYCSDNLARRSQPLQDTLPNHMASIHVHPTTAKNLGLTDGDNVIAQQDNNLITLPLLVDERLAENNILIPSGLAETAGFGSVFGAIELRRAERG
jgi:predicted molibdopterin-dependent oxidoreductase YjgC